MSWYLKIGLGILALGIAAHSLSVGHDHGLSAGINTLGTWTMAVGIGWIGIWLLRRVVLQDQDGEGR